MWLIVSVVWQGRIDSGRTCRPGGVSLLGGSPSSPAGLAGPPSKRATDNDQASNVSSHKWT